MTDVETTTIEALILELAEMEQECPFCVGQGNIECHANRDGDCLWEKCPQKVEYKQGCALANWDDEEAEVKQCLTCQGTGTAPRFALRRECPTPWCGKYAAEYQKVNYCGMCQGRGWLPLPVLEAAGVARQDEGFRKWLLNSSPMNSRVDLVNLLCDDEATLRAFYEYARETA